MQQTETRLIGTMYDKEVGRDVCVYVTYEDRDNSGNILGIHVQWQDDDSGEWKSRILKGDPELWIIASPLS